MLNLIINVHFDLGAFDLGTKKSIFLLAVCWVFKGHMLWQLFSADQPLYIADPKMKMKSKLESKAVLSTLLSVLNAGNIEKSHLNGDVISNVPGKGRSKC